jgi:2,4-dienoyl-CoA reductase-like NADH-dependent reductase (Old Yellow Enzyme family)
VAGGTVPNEHPLTGVSRFLRITGSLQKAVPDLPVVGTGYSWLRRYFPHVGAAVVRDKEAAFVGVGRGAFAYPDWVKDLKTKGQLDRGKVCITCSKCTQIMRDGGTTGCAVRDREVYLPIYKAGRKKRDR